MAHDTPDVAHGAIEANGVAVLIEFDPSGRLEADRPDCWIVPASPCGCFRVTCPTLASTGRPAPPTAGGLPARPDAEGPAPIPSPEPVGAPAFRRR